MDLIILVLPILGFIVGNLIGLTGIGGGFLMTPTLVLLGIPPMTAVGTDLLYAAISKGMGVTIYARRGNINSSILFFLLAGGIPATFIGYYLLIIIEAAYGLDTINSLMGLLLAIILIIVSSLYIIQIRLRGNLSVNTPTQINIKLKLLSIIIGFLTGLAVQFTSIGSGVLITFFLLYFITQPGKVVGTDIAFGFIITLIGGIQHIFIGHTDFFILLLLLAGASPGIIFGTKLNKRIQIGQFRLILMILMMITGIILLYRYFSIFSAL